MPSVVVGASPQGVDAHQRAKAFALGADVLFATGAGLVAMGVAVVLTAPRDRTTLLLRVTPGGQGVACSGNGSCCLYTFCNANACVACYAVDAGCTQDFQCCSGACNNGACQVRREPRVRVDAGDLVTGHARRACGRPGARAGPSDQEVALRMPQSDRSRARRRLAPIGIDFGAFRHR